MTMTFDDKPITSWTTKHPANAAAWWAGLTSPTEKQLFAKIVFADRPGPNAPLRELTPEQVGRILEFVLDSDALRAIVSAEISAEIARVTDQIRVETSVRLQAVPDEPEPAAKKAPPVKPEPLKTAPKKPEPSKPAPARKPAPKVEKPAKASKPEKDEKPARGRKKA